LKRLIESKPEFGIYHLPNEEETSWYEFAREIFAIMSADIKINPCTSAEFPRPARRPNYSILINNKLPKMRSWRGALREYLGK